MITTGRLTLESVEVRHVPDLIDAIAQSLAELRPWMGWAVDWDPVESRAYLTGRPANDHLHAIVLNGRAIGCVSVLVAKPLLGTGELGYWISTEEAGKGYMSEALDAFITWCFEDLKLHRLELRAGVDNGMSSRVAEKLGFQNRGLLREAATGATGYYDCHLWELLETDPRPSLDG